MEQKGVWWSAYDKQLICKLHVDTRNLLARFACFIVRNNLDHVDFVFG
jgi:hypothetical protein